jgi:hypothetical protein
MAKNRTVTEKTDYRSHRPFLIIDMIHSPAPHVRTNVKGWMDVEGNLKTTEVPYLVDRLAPRHLRQATVILDVFNNKLVKNRFSDTTDEQVYQHYARKYGEHIMQAVNIHRSRQGLPPVMMTEERVGQATEDQQPMTVTMV